jgi:hypothetical protein
MIYDFEILQECVIYVYCAVTFKFLCKSLMIDQKNGNTYACALFRNTVAPGYNDIVYMTVRLYR